MISKRDILISREWWRENDTICMKNPITGEIISVEIPNSQLGIWSAISTAKKTIIENLEKSGLIQ